MIPESPSPGHPGQTAPACQGSVAPDRDPGHVVAPGIQNVSASPGASVVSLGQPSTVAIEANLLERGQSGPSGLSQPESTTASDSLTVPQGRRASAGVAVLPGSSSTQAEATVSNKPCSTSPETQCHVVLHNKPSDSAPKGNDFTATGSKTPDVVVNEVLEALENNAQSRAATAEASHEVQDSASESHIVENPTPSLEPYSTESSETVQLGEAHASYV